MSKISTWTTKTKDQATEKTGQREGEGGIDHRQSNRKTIRAAKRPAERQNQQQTGIDQQSDKTDVRGAKRQAEQINGKS